MSFQLPDKQRLREDGNSQGGVGVWRRQLSLSAVRGSVDAYHLSGAVR